MYRRGVLVVFALALLLAGCDRSSGCCHVTGGSIFCPWGTTGGLPVGGGGSAQPPPPCVSTDPCAGGTLVGIGVECAGDDTAPSGSGDCCHGLACAGLGPQFCGSGLDQDDCSSAAECASCSCLETFSGSGTFKCFGSIPPISTSGTCAGALPAVCPPPACLIAQAVCQDPSVMESGWEPCCAGLICNTAAATTPTPGKCCVPGSPTTAVPTLAPCVEDADCCASREVTIWGYPSVDVCRGGKCCTPAGAWCADDSQCCGGAPCTLVLSSVGGVLVHTCGAPPPDAGACLPPRSTCQNPHVQALPPEQKCCPGTVCTADELADEPGYTPTGTCCINFPPYNGGWTCMQDSDCCGSDPDVVFGLPALTICKAGVCCEAPGTICDATAAKSDCCDGQPCVPSAMYPDHGVCGGVDGGASPSSPCVYEGAPCNMDMAYLAQLLPPTYPPGAMSVTCCAQQPATATLDAAVLTCGDALTKPASAVFGTWPPAGKCCRDDEQPCAMNASCCSGRCSTMDGECCRGVGERCLFDEQCCKEDDSLCDLSSGKCSTGPVSGP
jgi:hypothetical protein